MRPLPARILLLGVGLAGLAAGFLTGHLIFYVVALSAGVLLSTTQNTRRMPITQALLRFVGSEVDVRVWGTSPQPDGDPLVITAVNALGAGFHVFFRDSAGASIHLKVAQPHDVRLASDEVTVAGARYVQWNVKKIPAVAGAPALTVALTATARSRDLEQRLPED
jgi:hypothetical protein